MRYGLPIACLFAIAALACGSGADDETTPAGGGNDGGHASGGNQVSGGEAAGGQSAGGGGGGEGAGTPTACGSPMPRISDGMPAFASGGEANQANDEQPATAWHGDVPGWLAYDLSSVPVEDRQRVLVAWYAIHAAAYLSAIPDPDTSRPIDYAIEVNHAQGGGAPPASDWVELVNESENTRNGRQHVIELAGANWIRLVVSEGTDPGVGVDFDVHRAPGGATDAWLLMGDSITFMSTMYAFSDLPARAHAIDNASHPVVIDAGIGGTNTGTALDTIDAALEHFPGCYVALAYGTNDGAESFGPQMAALIEIVLAAGKIPVIPHMPWASGSTQGESINQQIDALYEQYPEVLPGPDLWATFEGRTDLIPEGDVHPNGEGMAVLRQAWAETIAGVAP